MKEHFYLGRASLYFLISYVAIGAVWYVMEVKVSPLAASAVSCLLTLPVYWFGSPLCLRAPKMISAMLLGIYWCLCAIVVDVILWVEPVGLLSEPLSINFSAEYFYMERYFPYLLITYAVMAAVPVLYSLIYGSGYSPQVTTGDDQ